MKLKIMIGVPHPPEDDDEVGDAYASYPPIDHLASADADFADSKWSVSDLARNRLAQYNRKAK